MLGYDVGMLGCKDGILGCDFYDEAIWGDKKAILE